MRVATKLGVVLLCAASAVLLVACTGPARPPAPLSVEARMAQLDHHFDRVWASLVSNHPNFARPDVRVLRVAQGSTWTQLMTRCLLRAGAVQVAVSPDGAVSVQGSGSTVGTLDLARYACDVEYPRKELLDSFLSNAQIGALYDYQVGFLQPCLLAFGRPASTPPSREAFIAGFSSGDEWDPYGGFRYSNHPTEADDLAKRCPRHPSWMVD